MGKQQGDAPTQSFVKGLLRGNLLEELCAQREFGRLFAGRGMTFNYLVPVH